MKIGTRITAFSLRHYKLVTGLMAALAIAVLLGAALPSLHLIKPLPESVKNFSRSLSFLPTVTVDTDPENMLSPDEPVRVFHDEMKKRMDLHDMIVVGVVNEHDPNGVFNPSSLGKIYELTRFARSLQFDQAGDTARQEQRQDAGEPSVEGLAEPSGIPGLDAPAEPKKYCYKISLPVAKGFSG